METENDAEPVRPDHRIVVGTDGSESAMRAVDWAAGQADRTGATLEIQTAYEPGYVFVTKDEIRMNMERLVSEAEARVAKLAPRVITKTKAHEESPATALIEASDGADILVVGSRGLGGFAGLLLGSVSLKCCLHARCPTIIIR